MRAAIAALACLACSANDTAGPPEPGEFSCDPADAIGTFLLSWELMDGDCTTPRDTLSTGGLFEVPAGCTRDRPDQATERGCKVEQAVTCTYDDGSTVSSVLVANQHDPDGRLFTGLMSLDPRDPAGNLICRAVYAVRAERQ